MNKHRDVFRGSAREMLTRRTKPEEIDYRRTSDEMILDGEFIPKDKRE